MNKSLALHFRSLDFDQFDQLYRQKHAALIWNCPFVLPLWLRTWYQCFADTFSADILLVSEGEKILGIAPLQIQGTTASFLGSESVCDYQDMIVAKENGDSFCAALLNFLHSKGIKKLQLGALLPASNTMQFLPEVCKSMGCLCEVELAGNSSEILLPSTWDEYLLQLDKKQRHEVRRKVKRLQEVGEVTYSVEDKVQVLERELPLFFTMFAESRADKDQFLTATMKRYFESLMRGLAENGMARLGILRVNAQPLGVTFGFEYANTFYLYNNGYSVEHRKLSPGVLSKVFNIQYCLNQKLAHFNFLKGDEVYKKRLGATFHPLYRLVISL